MHAATLEVAEAETLGEPDGTPVVEFLDVSKAFRTHQVIRQLSFAVRQEEIVALVGTSGSGKSTVLNMAGLLEHPDSGQIRLFGASAPRIGSPAALRLLRTKIGYLFQNSALIDQDSIEANLKLAQAFTTAPKAEQARQRTNALADVGLDTAPSRRVYELSGGEQQRLAMARLMLKPSDLVLADEPTGSLDSSNRDVVLALLAGLRDHGKTVLLVTHDPVVAAAADRIIEL